MIDIEKFKEEALKAIEDANSLELLEKLKNDYLSKKGKVQDLMAEMRNLAKEEKPKFGQLVNNAKSSITEAIENKLNKLNESLLNEKLARESVDITLNAYKMPKANLHPLTLIQDRLEEIFTGMGYKVVEGPEVELSDYNFTRANIDENHPARDPQDTFYINPSLLLRTQTTAIQMRELEKEGKNIPIKVICPGKVYRRDDDDATHSHQFVQCEGLVVGENITVADLKGTLELMIHELFNKDTELRFRPSYFPFTEPSFEIDMTCHVCGGKGCPTCKGTGYIEILGSGMVHPNVLETAGIDSKKYTGFAFGVGIDRLAMLKYDIKDVRDLYTNDIRFLSNFKGIK